MKLRHDPEAEPNSSAEQTRRALIAAALSLFGRQGYDGTSTRQIATEAKANIGSIAYHFGGKDGLRLAAADHIVQTMQAVALQAGANAPPQSAQEAADRLETVLRAMLTFIVARPEAGQIVQFVLRELANPTPALDRIYDGVFEPLHKRLCGVWQIATGEAAESDAAKLAVFTMIGQVVYFRIGREAVLRRMGWTDIGRDEAEKIVSTAIANLRAAIQARRSS